MATIERTKNATRNIVFGLILKIYQIVVPFIMRTAMLYLLGVEYLGLNSLFVSVLQVLNIAELGVGSAMVYSMYKPIVEDDKNKICALMKLYQLYYRIIGLVITILGLILLPFIHKMISGDIPPNVNMYVLYILNLGATILSYWLFAYKNCLLDAHQRVDINSKIAFILTTIQYSSQLVVLIYVKSYYLYLIIALLTQVMKNIITAIIVNKMYPQYKANGKLDKKEINMINNRVKDLFTSKIGGVIVNSSDTLVISAFLGLSMLSMYQNYFFILNSIILIISIIFNSCMAGIGNSIIVETKEKNFNDFKKFTFITVWLSGICTCCLLCLYQPFMKIWVGQKYELAFSVVVCLCIYYFIYEINQLLNMYKDAAGIWHEDRFRPLVTALSNLIMNLILVQWIGIYGVVLSTVISMLFIGMPWLLHNLFTVLFEKKHLAGYVGRLVLYSAVTVTTSCFTYFTCSFINFSPWIELITKGLVCIFIPNVVFWVVYRKTSEFEQCVKLADKITRGKLCLEKMLV